MAQALRHGAVLRQGAGLPPEGPLEAAMEFLLCVVGAVAVALLCSFIPWEGFDFTDSSNAGSADGDGGD